MDCQPGTQCSGFRSEPPQVRTVHREPVRAIGLPGRDPQLLQIRPSEETQGQGAHRT